MRISKPLGERFKMSKICEDMGISLSLFQEFRQKTRMFKYSSIEG